MNLTAIHVRLPEGVPERIDAIVGKNKRPDFIRQAILTALQAEEAKAGR
jgi:metal-responsive CopG/Arc/MetJ family transcriptional regulator